MRCSMKRNRGSDSVNSRCITACATRSTPWTTAQDLPHAFVHPDFVPANAIPTPDERLVIVDWAGAGRGPRLWSLGFLLWASGARSMRLVDVVVSRYRRHVVLEPEELTRLAWAIRLAR